MCIRDSQLQLSRLQHTIDKLKAKLQDKDDIIYGLRCQLAATAGHASPVRPTQHLASATAGHASPELFDLFDSGDDAGNSSDQLQRSHLKD
eukprot:10754053-Karenia_brevis.AAC.1